MHNVFQGPVRKIVVAASTLTSSCGRMLVVEVTQSTKAIDPLKDILVSSVDAAEAGCTEGDDGGTVAVLQEASKQSCKRKRPLEDWLQEYLIERKAEKRQRWEQAKKLK